MVVLYKRRCAYIDCVCDRAHSGSLLTELCTPVVFRHFGSGSIFSRVSSSHRSAASLVTSYDVVLINIHLMSQCPPTDTEGEGRLSLSSLQRRSIPILYGPKTLCSTHYCTVHGLEWFLHILTEQHREHNLQAGRSRLLLLLLLHALCPAIVVMLWGCCVFCSKSQFNKCLFQH